MGVEPGNGNALWQNSIVMVEAGGCGCREVFHDEWTYPEDSKIQWTQESQGLTAGASSQIVQEDGRQAP